RIRRRGFETSATLVFAHLVALPFLPAELPLSFRLHFRGVLPWTTFPPPLLRQPAGGGPDQREDCPRMTRQYEAVYVFDSTLEDAAINDKLGRFHGLLGNPADLQLNHWGRRQLAYPIGRRESGYYVVARFGAETTTLPEYERAIKLDEGIVRHLITLF